MFKIPRTPGVYILIVYLSTSTTLTIGALGVASLPAGFYAYVGSAMGPGGLYARIRRHLSSKKRIKWHIDYVLKAGKIVGVIYGVSSVKRECEVASLIAKRYSFIVKKLGSTDCKCISHFFYIGESRDSVKSFLKYVTTIGNIIGVSFSLTWV